MLAGDMELFDDRARERGELGPVSFSELNVDNPEVFVSSLSTLSLDLLGSPCTVMTTVK